MANWTETTADIAGTQVALIRGGAGKPLLVLHDEMGYTGWMTWNEELAKTHELIIPLQPGFGKTPRIDWIRNYRDLAGFYAIMVREMNLDSLDVLGFSAGGYIAAEMAAADPRMVKHLVLVAPMGIKPATGEIMDIFPMTARSFLRATVADVLGTPEFAKIYGGEMTRNNSKPLRMPVRKRRVSDGSRTCTTPACPICWQTQRRFRRSWYGAQKTVLSRVDVSTPTGKHSPIRRLLRSQMSAIVQRLKIRLNLFVQSLRFLRRKLADLRVIPSTLLPFRNIILSLP